MACAAVTVKPIPEPARETVRALWGRSDRPPEYWTSDTPNNDQPCVSNKVCWNRLGAFQVAMQVPEPGKLLWGKVGLSYRLTGRRDRPIPNLRNDQPIIASLVYPYQSDFTMNRIGLEPVPERRPFALNFLISPQRLGFAYCDGPKMATKEFDFAGALIAINGMPIAEIASDHLPSLFIHRDQNVIEYRSVTLTDIFGGL